MSQKFSQFTNGGDLRVGDKVVGLRDGINSQFDSPGTGIRDVNGSYILKYETTSPGVTQASNYPLIIAQQTGLSTPFVTYSADGSETNVSLKLIPKGNGYIFLGSSSQPINLVSNSVSLNDTSPGNTLSTQYAVKSYVDTTINNLVNSGTVENANNIAGGSSNDIVYQTSSGSTGFISETSDAVLVYNGSGVPLSSKTLPTGLAISTPASGTLTNCTGLPVSTGISGLASGMSTFLANPSSSNLAATVTDHTGTGSLVFSTSPTLVTPNIGSATGSSLNLSGLTASRAVVTDASKNLTSLAYSSTATASALVSYDSNSNINCSNIISNYTSITSSGGTSTLTISSTRYIYITGSSTQTVVLPAVATFTSGQAVTYIIINKSSGACTVNTSGGNTVAALTNLQRLEITWLGTSGTGTSPWTWFLTTVLN